MSSNLTKIFEILQNSGKIASKTALFKGIGLF